MEFDIFRTVGILLPAYLVGSIPWGFIIGKFNGLDIRRHGSHNIGATNVVRTMGKGWGYLCFLLDFLKGALPVLVVAVTTDPAKEPWIPVLTAAAVVLGHIYPVYLNFKGGKGVATSIGVLVALAPLPLFGSLILWVVVFQFSRYVSLASCIAAAMFPIFGLMLRIQEKEGNPTTPTLLLMLGLAIMILFRHKENIRRLRNGTESRFHRKKS
jgi:glycerol-3-phosphate acyltransferase PlsY